MQYAIYNIHMNLLTHIHIQYIVFVYYFHFPSIILLLQWRSLDISGIERRRLCCSILFHCAAALCVIWSLCVLIERAAEDVQRGHIGITKLTTTSVSVIKSLFKVPKTKTEQKRNNDILLIINNE